MGEAEAGLLGAVAAVYLAGGLVKGAMGFGMPIVTISLLPFLLPVEAALATNAVVLVGTNLLQVVQAGEHRQAFRLAAPILLGLAIATPVGVGVATALPQALLMGLLGAFIVGFCGLQLAGLPRATGGGAAGERRMQGFAVGLAGGLVGAFTSTPGSVFAMHFAASRLARPLFMATLGMLMGAVGLALALSLSVAGVLTAERWLLAGVGLAPAFAGFWLGNRIGRSFSVEGFRKAVLVLLCLLGAAMIQRALAG